MDLSAAYGRLDFWYAADFTFPSPWLLDKIGSWSKNPHGIMFSPQANTHGVFAR